MDIEEFRDDLVEHFRRLGELGIVYVNEHMTTGREYWRVTINGTIYELGDTDTVDVNEAMDKAEALIRKVAI